MHLLRDTAAPWCFSCSFPLARLPHCQAVGAMFQQHTEGWGAAALQSPVTPPAGPAWTGGLDRQTEKRMPDIPKNCRKLGKYILAKHCFSPIPIYSLQHAVSCEVGPRKPKSSKILLCLSNLTIASIQITFFMFYRNCPVRPKEQLRDFLRD